MPQHPLAARNTLITGLVLVFGAFGIDKFWHPLIWIGWMPTWMDGLMGLPTETWLPVIGAIEIVLAAALLFPWRPVRMTSAALMALHLVSVILQAGINDIGIRDAGLLSAAIALLFLL